jgi:hypothetical protein
VVKNMSGPANPRGQLEQTRRIVRHGIESCRAAVRGELETELRIFLLQCTAQLFECEMPIISTLPVGALEARRTSYFSLQVSRHCIPNTVYHLLSTVPCSVVLSIEYRASCRMSCAVCHPVYYSMGYSGCRHTIHTSEIYR